MRCWIRVDVGKRKDAKAIELALSRPDVRAFALIVGTLEPFDDRARARILQFVSDSVDSQSPRPAPRVLIPSA